MRLYFPVNPMCGNVFFFLRSMFTFKRRILPLSISLYITTFLFTAFCLFQPFPVSAVTLSKSTFAPYVNDIFMAEVGSEVVELQLLQIIDSSNEKMESFVLQFVSSQSKIFQQKTYNLQHEELGGFSLFLVPTGKDDKGSYYEAVITKFLHD